MGTWIADVASDLRVQKIHLAEFIEKHSDSEDDVEITDDGYSWVTVSNCYEKGTEGFYCGDVRWGYKDDLVSLVADCLPGSWLVVRNDDEGPIWHKVSKGTDDIVIVESMSVDNPFDDAAELGALRSFCLNCVVDSVSVGDVVEWMEDDGIEGITPEVAEEIARKAAADYRHYVDSGGLCRAFIIDAAKGFLG